MSPAEPAAAFYQHGAPEATAAKKSPYRLQDRAAIDATVNAEELMLLLASIDPVDTTLGLRPGGRHREKVIGRILGGLRVPAESQPGSPQPRRRE